MMTLKLTGQFKKDKIGRKLYEMYLKAKEESENF